MVKTAPPSGSLRPRRRRHRRRRVRRQRARGGDRSNNEERTSAVGQVRETPHARPRRRCRCERERADHDAPPPRGPRALIAAAKVWPSPFTAPSSTSGRRLTSSDLTKRYGLRHAQRHADGEQSSEDDSAGTTTPKGTFTRLQNTNTKDAAADSRRTAAPPRSR